MKRYIVGALMAVLLVSSCSAGSSASSGSHGGSVATNARPSTSAKVKDEDKNVPSTENPYSDSPRDPATIKRMLTAQGFKNVQMDEETAVSFDDPACPAGLVGNLGGVRIKDGHLHLLITHDGVDFLDVDRPPTRQQLDEYGLCPLSNMT